ncbi:MAG TPA: ABC transporter substrate-binding protein [Blastocatellia bacterium]|nr:ABC transporter substrate-binding protein [Blastocatellia bacterium]
MRVCLSRARSIVVISALAAVAALQSRGFAGAQGKPALTPQERRGKQIYLKGEAGGGEIIAYLGSSELELPASSFTCANCHGPRGEGLKEGGLEPPPIDWETLTSGHLSSLTGRERPPYDETTLARAISAGIGSGGEKLHPGMPRYKMTSAQMADLIAYLKRMGGEADLDPGLTGETIKVGAALPVTGPLAAIGEDVKMALEAIFTDINSQGGIYGRKFELVVEDSGGHSDGALEATRRLVERDGVFALVASFERGDSDATSEFLRRREVPLIGPVTLSPRIAAVPNPYVFYLLPSFGDQARSLADYVAAEASQSNNKTKPDIAVIWSDSDFDRGAREGLLAQARLHSMDVVFDQGYRSGKLAAVPLAEALGAKRPDAVFYFGGPDEFAALARAIDEAKLELRLYSSAMMVGQAAFSLPASVASRTYLAYAAAVPDQAEFAEFLSVMRRGGVTLRNMAFQSVAYAAARLLVEATKSSGRHLSRAGLIKALEQLKDFKTGVVPPLSFGPNRRIGARGSLIVGIDPVNRQYRPLTDRIVPKENRH